VPRGRRVTGEGKGPRRPPILCQLGCGVGVRFVARICAHPGQPGLLSADRARGRRVERFRAAAFLFKVMNPTDEAAKRCAFQKVIFAWMLPATSSKVALQMRQ
jgi:hypothetical protein